MTTDETIMEEMLERATNPVKETVDELGVQMFCIVVRSNIQLVHKAQEMIVTKIRSNNVTEAMRAISLLEECMTQCGSDFQDEASKFRFLNELIRLVSKKYQGAETPDEVKQRIMECLLLWTTEFPQKLKIREAYDMLRKEDDSIVDHALSSAAMAKRESVLGMDEEVFAKLVKSNDPENFKRANRLLQYRMDQVARRNELLLQHKCVLLEVQNTLHLLNQMLDTYDPLDVEGRETMREIYQICKKHKPIFQHLPELLDQSETVLIADTLETNSALQEAMLRYKEIVEAPAKGATAAPVAARASAAKFAATPSTDLFSEFLSDLDNAENPTASSIPSVVKDTTKTLTTTTTTTSSSSSTNTLAELRDIFGSVANTVESAETSEPAGKQYPPELYRHLDLLEPETVCLNSTTTTNGLNESLPEQRKLRNLREIDQLSEQLFKQSLPTQERVSSFKRDVEKVTLNDLVKEKFVAKTVAVKSSQQTRTPTESNSNKSLIDDVQILTDNPTKEQSAATSSKQVTGTVITDSKNEGDTGRNIDNNSLEVKQQPKHLSEISIDLDNIIPTAEQRLLLDDDDIQLTLNFTAERPSKHVTVIVISAQNKSKFQIKDFQFEASVKKPCKVRLLSPTDNVMPPSKPFRPANPINQVMLLLNSTGQAVDVTCIVGYKLGDDPDPIKESIVAKNIPFAQ